MAGKPSKSRFEEREGILFKSCTVCQVFYPADVENFAKHNQTLLGIGPRCRECTRLLAIKQREADPFMISYSKIKRRAIDKGLPFNLTKSYLQEIWKGTCPVFDFPIKIGETGMGYALPNSAALDQIIPENGYIQGNVVWLSTKANLIKQNAKPSEVMAVVKWMKENINE